MTGSAQILHGNPVPFGSTGITTGGLPMKHFFVNVSLKASQKAIEPRKRLEHEMHFRAGFSLGLFLFYGPRNPPDGFIAVARAESRQTLDWFLKEDPLLTDGMAAVEILEFQPAGFKWLLNEWMHPIHHEDGFASDQERVYI
jgi:uncharacterized protein YciI